MVGLCVMMQCFAACAKGESTLVRGAMQMRGYSCAYTHTHVHECVGDGPIGARRYARIWRRGDERESGKRGKDVGKCDAGCENSLKRE